jgi:hypothetical protein
VRPEAPGYASEEVSAEDLAVLGLDGPPIRGCLTPERLDHGLLDLANDRPRC